jgi:hypothetical protein
VWYEYVGVFSDKEIPSSTVNQIMFTTLPDIPKEWREGVGGRGTFGIVPIY